MSFIKDFKESNRWKHFICAIPIGLILTILCVLGVAGGMEFKDKKYSSVIVTGKQIGRAHV